MKEIDISEIKKDLRLIERFAKGDGEKEKEFKSANEFKSDDIFDDNFFKSIKQKYNGDLRSYLDSLDIDELNILSKSCKCFI